MKEAYCILNDSVQFPFQLNDCSFQDMGLPSGDGEGYYVPPTKGTNQSQVWVNNSHLPVDHVVAGSFDSAARVCMDKPLLLSCKLPASGALTSSFPKGVQSHPHTLALVQLRL